MGSVLSPGEARAPSPSAQEILHRDGRPVPQAYQQVAYRFLGDEVIDVAHYHVFPNMMVLPGLTLPAVYRFRPIANDPDRTLFEILLLREVPANGQSPEPAEPVRLTEAQSYAAVPGYDPFLAEIYDQDTNNLRAQQEGFKTSRKPGQTLLNYQEVRVRLLHQTLDGYLNGPVPQDFASDRTGVRKTRGIYL